MSRVAYPFGHFPIPVTHGTPSSTTNPIGLSLADAMRWYWLIKQVTVKVTISGTYTPPADGNGGTSTLTVSNAVASGVFGVAYYDNPYQLLTDETQLVLGAGIGQTVSITQPDPSTITVSSGGQTSVDASNYVGMFGVSGQSGITPLVLSAGLYYPGLSFGVDAGFSGTYVDDNGVTNTLGFSLNATMYLDSYDTNDIQGTANFLGHPLSLFYAGFSDSGGQGLSGLSMDVEVTESAEWPYAG